jgi:hypothetical protein
MGYGVQDAIHSVCEKGFTNRVAKAVVDLIGPEAVLSEADPRSASRSGEAIAFVKSFGHSADVAAKHVANIGEHIVLAVKRLHAPSDTHSFWDVDVEKAATPAPGRLVTEPTR